MKDSIPADFIYFGEVLQSDLTPSAKLFFASLMTESAFRTRFGICRSEWNEHPAHLESIRSLEEAGFISAAWDGTRMPHALCPFSKTFTKEKLCLIDSNLCFVVPDSFSNTAL